MSTIDSPYIQRALISVSNKKELVPFAEQLISAGIEILATGGTAQLLHQHSIPLINVPEYTGFPEILGGRLKTLHPKIYGGLLRRPGIDDEVLKKHHIEPIDLVIVNLYPFNETISEPDCDMARAIEHIDIGGPAMLRAAAKNYHTVTVVIDPSDYEIVAREIQKYGKTSLETRRRLATKAFAHTSAYDQAIYEYFQQNDPKKQCSDFAEDYYCHFKKKMDLRYGENPHQKAALYVPEPTFPHSLAQAELRQGKPLSYNNYLDSDTALQCIRSFPQDQAGCVIVKHATPCGAARAENLHQAYQKALLADPTSAFGGIIAVNRCLDVETAQAIISQQFVEVILAPEFASEALELFKHKPNWRLLICSTIPEQMSLPEIRSINGGILVQQTDFDETSMNSLMVATERKPSTEEWRDLIFAWQVVRFVKSNAIVYVKNQTTVGIGGGQTSRVFSAQIAALKAEQNSFSLAGAVAASDAFFPFADGLELIAQAGIKAIIQPGGAKRDPEIISAANRYGIAMVFTGVRHFRH